MKGAIESFQRVLEKGPKVELDHHLIYYTRLYFTVCFRFRSRRLLADYELGRLHACTGKLDDARKEFELVLSGSYFCLVIDQ